MLAASAKVLPLVQQAAGAVPPILSRTIMMSATQQPPAKKEGDISDAFVSLSGTDRTPLPDKFRQLKCDLVNGHEVEVQHAWKQLLGDLKKEVDIIRQKRSAVVPEIQFSDLESGLASIGDEVRKRGVLVVKGVVPEQEARAYKAEVEEYVRKNPHTRAFPAHDPQVYELYWSGPQLKARSHPSLLKTQRLLMSHVWRTSDPSSKISISTPLSYADRLRIRQPGDANFALGPHMDGGSVERWEKDGYGLSHTYDKIFRGDVAGYDPWDASRRVDVQANLYNGLGACSMFRMWQGWLSMSHTDAGQGTLLVNPLLKHATAYLLLRPFFTAIEPKEKAGDKYLDVTNWKFTGMEGMSSDLQGATPGHGQELNDELHPHLELETSMVHVPNIKPGDFVAWHCDTIHAVDKVHAGDADSSVLYIPVCPVTDINAHYMVRQRNAFLDGHPGPDFPGGVGEADHVDRPGVDSMSAEGRAAMGLDQLTVGDEAPAGAREAIESANRILAF